MLRIAIVEDDPTHANAGFYGYMISDNCIRNGNDMMLGFWGSPVSNDFT